METKGNTGKKGGQYGNQNAAKWREKDALRLVRELYNFFKEDESRIYFEEYLYFTIDEQLPFPTEIYADTISELSKRFPSFAERMSKIKQIQEFRLKTRGLNNETNSNITKFLLSANFGLKEKTEVVQENNIKVSIDNKDITGEIENG